MLNGLLHLYWFGVCAVLVSLLNLAVALAPSGLRASVSDAGETQASAFGNAAACGSSACVDCWALHVVFGCGRFVRSI